MDGCPKYKIDPKWMKRMLNWDLYIHPASKAFDMNTPGDEKRNLSLQWMLYMEDTYSWIFFYSWEEMEEGKEVHMANVEVSSTQKHSWTSHDGTR